MGASDWGEGGVADRIHSCGSPQEIHAGLLSGEIDIIVGTHALIEDSVQFHLLGLVVIDEQHRFGVAQRGKLWHKSEKVPHVLVMTATPIPRTLAMTVYGDLEVSVIDELPPGRKPITTLLRYDSNRMEVDRLIFRELRAGRQIYIVYPLIEENEKLDLKSLEEGYQRTCDTFPWLSRMFCAWQDETCGERSSDGYLRERRGTYHGGNDGHRGRRECA